MTQHSACHNSSPLKINNACLSSIKIRICNTRNMSTINVRFNSKSTPQLHILELHFEIEGYITFLLYLLLEFLLTGTTEQIGELFNGFLKGLSQKLHANEL